MGQFELSRTVISVVKRLSALNISSFNSLRGAVAGAKLTFSIDELVQQVYKKVDSVDTEQVEGTLHTLLSIYSAHRDSKLDWDELFAKFSRSLGDELSKEELETAIVRLRELIESGDSIQLISKAMDVCNERDKVFQSSRILTDVRPIFRDDEHRLALGAAAVVHSLKIEYRHGPNLDEMYFALDDDDLNKLAKDIRRAKEKSKQVHELLKTSNLPFITESTEEEE